MIDETVEEIEEMQTHSSSVVAVKAAEALRDLLARDYPTVEEYVRDLERNSSALRRANPSHASLHATQQEIVDRVETANAATIPEVKDVTDEVIADVVATVETGKSEAAAAAAERLEDGDALLTHDYSTTVLEAVEQAAADGKHLTVYVTEARPRFLGRKTARTLASIDRVEPHLLVDSACATVLSECDMALLGMTCIVDDTYYNRVGTFPIAATAAELAVRVEVVGASAKVVESGGFAFENDYRSASEVMREPAEGFTIENPAYDATPTHLVDLVVTDDGTRKP